MDVPDREEFIQQVRTMQVIVVALAMGVAAFGLVLVLFIQPEPMEGEPLIAYVAAGVAVMCVLVGLAVPSIIVRQQPATVSTFQTKLITTVAIFEGAAFFNLAAYLIEGQLFSLAVAAALLVLILMQFPTVGRVHDWLDARQRQDRESRAFDQ